MKFHYSATARATDNGVVCDRAENAPCGTRRRPNASRLCLTSLAGAVTCDKCKAMIRAL